METKQIIAIMAVLALAVIGVGAAYAYSASLDNTDNTAATEYLAISVNNATAGSYTGTFGTDDLRFNTVTAWDADAEEQVITYTPKVGDTDAAQIDQTAYKGVAIGTALTMTVDSSLMSGDKSYLFKVSTADLTQGTGYTAVNELSTEGAFLLKYTAQNSDPSLDKTGYKLMDADSVALFLTDIKDEETVIMVQLYALEIKSDVLIPNTDLSYQNIKFTFTAEVDEDIGELTIKATEKDGTTAVSDAAISIMGQNGADIFVTPIAEDNQWTVTLPKGTYIIGAEKTNYKFKSVEAQLTTAGTEAVVAEIPTDFTITQVPNQTFNSIPKSAGSINLAGMTISVAYATPVDVSYDSASTSFAVDESQIQKDGNNYVPGTYTIKITYTADDVNHTQIVKEQQVTIVESQP